MTTQGAANRTKGLVAERAVVAFLRDNGWPNAERAVRTGYRTAERTSVDPGDITGTPGLLWQVKDVAKDETAKWLTETEVQRYSAGVDIGVLVHKRRGHAKSGEWWAWVKVRDIAGPVAAGVGFAPVRMELADLVVVLRNLGYGEST